MSPNNKIYVAGHRGMVGSAIVRQLLAAGHPATHLITRTHTELDLTNQAAVRNFFESEQPEQVYLAAAKVGGIHANNVYPADFIYDNLMIQANVIDAAFRSGVCKLLFLGSSCIYPKLAAQPMREDALLTGTLEATNEPYAIAKIAGIKLCESYSRYLEELGAHRPDILAACRAAFAQPNSDLDFVRVDEAAFRACPDESIDYAVMEKTSSAVVVPMDAGWSDVGAFAALWEVLPHDEHGNVHRGDVISHDSHDNLVFAENALVATVGLRDHVVVQTKDAVMVAPRDRAGEVKQIVARLKASGRNEHQLHREVYRPWGQYDSIEHGDRYQVKRITVKPGQKLSVQMHHHRAEHWIVVKGTARVTLEGQDRLLTENESIYLPVGSVHALENPGRIPLELIEVQVGSYLGEDDIVRFEDRYGRA